MQVRREHGRDGHGIKGLEQRPGERGAVAGGGAFADFVEEDEGVGGAVPEEDAHVVHLEREGGLALFCLFQPTGGRVVNLSWWGYE